MKNVSLMAALAVGVLVGAAAPQTPSADVLMEADRRFNADMARDGAAAWAAWMAEDGALIQQGIGEIRGRDAVYRALAPMDEIGATLTWDPERAEIAASGDLGWTTGSYVAEGPGPDGSAVRQQGRYVTIWRKEQDGSWKVVMDLGNTVQ